MQNDDATSVKKQPRKRQVVLATQESRKRRVIRDSDDEGSVDVAIVQNDDATSVQKQPRKRQVVLDDAEDEGTVVAIVPNDHATSVQHNYDNKQTMFWSLENMCYRIIDSKIHYIYDRRNIIGFYGRY